MRKALKTLLILFLVLFALAGAAFGGWYWYDNNVDRSGWVLTDGVYSYKDFYGDYVTGWQEIGGETYYFHPQDCSMATYWQDLEGKRLYFSGDGTLDTGFWQIDGERYYFAPDGAMATYWHDIQGSRYYFEEDGTMVTDWQEIDGSRYYFDANGVMATGLTDLKGYHYKFQDDGKLYTGWDTLAGEIIYYLPEGPRAFYWQEINEHRYYFGSDGVLTTGWLTMDGDDYYFHEDGSAAAGPTDIGGTTYYFTPLGIHIVLVNNSHQVPDYYKLELTTFGDWAQVSTECYDNLLKMLTACNNAGHEYTIASAYRSYTQQQKILKDRQKWYMENQEMTEAEAYQEARLTVALPGTSEHHLGLALDLNGEGALEWLHEHCWEYGFIVRYDGAKAHITGIIDEPWHFRYVGITTAMDMKDSGLCLEEYLGAA